MSVWWTLFESLTRLVAGGLLTAGAIWKLSASWAWRQAWLTSYQLLPRWTVPLVSQLLPVGELVCGIAVLVGALGSVAVLAASALFSLFAAAVASALLRGLALSCGCLNPSDQLISWRIVGRNLGVTLGLAVVAWHGLSGPTVQGFSWPVQVAVVGATASAAVLSDRVARISQRRRFVAALPRPAPRSRVTLNDGRRVVPVLLTCSRDLPTFRIFARSFKDIRQAVASPVVVIDTSNSQAASPEYQRLIASLEPRSTHAHPRQPGTNPWESVQHASHFALMHALEETQPQDLVLFLEDDIVFSRWFPDALRAYEPPTDAGFQTFYLPGNGYGSTVIDVRSGWPKRSRFFGSQCLLFPRHAVLELVDAYDQLQTLPFGYDIRWSQFLSRRGYRLYATHSSFVQHIGASRIGTFTHCSRRFIP